MQDHTEQDIDPKTTKAPRIGLFFTWFFIIMMVSVLTYGYFRSMRSNLLLAHLVNVTEHQLESLQEQLHQVKAQQINLQQSFNSAQNTASAAQIAGDKQHNLASIALHEAYFLVSLADDYLQLLHDQNTAKTLLLAAANKIQNIAESSVNGIREAILRDLTAINGSASEAAMLYVSLAALHNQIDALPLLKMPLEPLENAQVKTYPVALTFWQRAGHYLIEGLQKIVIVRHDDIALPLIVPQEKMFLYQNLHAQLEGVMWASLHHQSKIYQTNLMMMSNWIKRYFDTHSALTQATLAQLTSLQKENIEPTEVNLAPTLTLFDQYFAKQH